MTIANFGSGEIEMVGATGAKIRLDRESANRLIMAGRMHTVAEFVEKIPTLIPEPSIASEILETFGKASTSSEKWNLKEKFARLTTLSKGHEPENASEVFETVTL